jgi:NAD(P)-dependent dehydrogenase (short-subunit alcohol dehydrogenase family)
MLVQPDSDLSTYKPAGKLKGKVALITGGDSGIGRAVATAYAMEGADVSIAFNHSKDDAADTRRMVEARGRRCLTILGDVTVGSDRERIVGETVSQLGRLDILVNNAAYFEGDGTLGELEEDGLRRIFETNIIAYMLMAQAALPHLETVGGTIINTSSTTSILGKKGSLAYSSSKGAVNVFTKSLALEVADKGIRVNAVLPGPFWTPAIATSDENTVGNFGTFTMMKRAGQPEEIAPAYVSG